LLSLVYYRRVIKSHISYFKIFRKEDILNGKVLTYGKVLVGIIPGFEHSISDAESGCLVSSKVLEVKSSHTECVLYMVHD